MRKFLKKSGGNSENCWYLVDDVEENPRDFVYVYSFMLNKLELIPFQDLETQFSEMYCLRDEPEALTNSIRTPDGTILKSRHRHDYVVYIDTITNEEYMIDGGLDYMRTNVNKVPAENLSIDTDSPFSLKRRLVEWGGRGKDNKQPLTFKSISEMSNEHILAVIENVKNTNKNIIDVMKEEIIFRIKNGITVED